MSDDSSATVTVVAIAAVPLVSWFPDVLTPGRFILPVPSNDTPPMFLAVSRAVAVAEFPVQDPDEPLALPVTLPVKAPENVPDSTSVLELNVSPLAVFGPRSPVAAVTNNGKQVVSVDSSAIVIVVGT